MIRNRPIFWVLIGMPGSGKTTWRDKQLLARPDTAVITSDDFIEAAARGAGISYREMFPLMHHGALRARLLDRVKQHAECKNHMILDRTNLAASSRKLFIEATPGYNHVAVVFHRSAASLRAVNEARKAIGRDIPTSAWQQLRATYDRPHKAEGFNEIVYIKTP